MTKRLRFIAQAIVVAICLHEPALPAAAEKLTLTQPPRDGISAGCRVTVEGRASLGPGEHAWIFAARKNFADLGLVWLQGEADVDPSSQAFSLPVTLGIADDIGSNFRISVAILDDATHNRMRAKLLEMMTSNRHLPVPFPPTVYPPVHRTVKKVSHEGC
jgi:hypothetical protein